MSVCQLLCGRVLVLLLTLWKHLVAPAAEHRFVMRTSEQVQQV